MNFKDLRREGRRFGSRDIRDIQGIRDIRDIGDMDDTNGGVQRVTIIFGDVGGPDRLKEFQGIDDQGSHGGGFFVAAVEEFDPTVFNTAMFGIQRQQVVANFFDAARRGQLVHSTIETQSSTRNDQLIDLRCREMFEQARHIVIDAVAAKMFGRDQFVVVGQATQIDAEFDSFVHGRQPPRLRRPHRHSKCRDALLIDFGPGFEIVERLDKVEHHHAPKDSALPEHEFESVGFADRPIGVVFALSKTPAVDGQGRHSQIGEDRSVWTLFRKPCQ